MDQNQTPETNTPEASLRGQLLWLRFDAALEPQFLRDHEAAAQPSRVALLLLALLLIGATPLYDVPLLNMPDALWLPARLLQFGMQIPAILLALPCVLRPDLQRWAPPAIIFATLVVAAGLEAQRLLGAPLGFHVPPVFVVLTLTAVLVLGRLRLFTLLPWVLLAMVANTVIELRTFSNDSARLYDNISTWMLFMLAIAAAWFREYAERQHWHQQHRLEYELRHDWLTGLLNRQGFEEVLRAQVTAAIDQNRPLSLMLLDLDGFGPYNVRYGRLAGDAALRRVAMELARHCQGVEIICARTGGEEFTLLWPGQIPQAVCAPAEQLRAAIRKLGIINEAMLRDALLSASAGLAGLDADGDDTDPKRLSARLQRQAEEALHQAKAEGRDRLVLSAS